MVDSESRTGQILYTLDGPSVFDRIDQIIDAAHDWRFPRTQRNRTIRKAYRRFKYPTNLTKELKNSSDFAIPEFDEQDAYFTTELFCELFPGPLLMPCITIEEFISQGRTIKEIAECFDVPEDNAAIRIATYYMLRFSPVPEVRAYLNGIEKLGFTLYAEAAGKDDPELSSMFQKFL